MAEQKEERKEVSGGISRREFLKDASLVAGGGYHRLYGFARCLRQLGDRDSYQNSHRNFSASNQHIGDGDDGDAQRK
jgi:hypothetical protein